MKKRSKRGLCLGLIFTLMLSGTSCGKEEIVVDDYGGESVVETDSSESASDEKSDGRSLTEFFGERITDNESFNLDGISVSCDINYKVPEADQIYVYEGDFVKNDSDIEKQIVNSFFGGTEKNLEEIRYENDSDYIPLLYKYRSILRDQESDITPYSDSSFTPELFQEYVSVIDSSFDKVYKWVDEVAYSIHMYEGEYNGNRYGMIYSYDVANSKRNIFISPISMAEYFPDSDTKTLFVVEQDSESESDNICTMSEDDIKNEAGDVLEKLGLKSNDIVLTYNPNMAIPDIVSGVRTNMSEQYGDDVTYTQIPKLVFTDSDTFYAFQELSSKNPLNHILNFSVLKEQQSSQAGQAGSGEVNFKENGYAVFLCADPFSDNVTPQHVSTFNRGSIYYTDKGLFSVDISLVTEIDNVVEDVQLISFDNVKESLKVAMKNDSVLSERSKGSLEIFDVNFTYVLIKDKGNNDKATYVPAWVFKTKDKNLKSGDEAVEYMHIINAIDGSDLNDVIQ